MLRKRPPDNRKQLPEREVEVPESRRDAQTIGGGFIPCTDHQQAARVPRGRQNSAPDIPLVVLDFVFLEVPESRRDAQTIGGGFIPCTDHQQAARVPQGRQNSAPDIPLVVLDFVLLEKAEILLLKRLPPVVL